MLLYSENVPSCQPFSVYICYNKRKEGDVVSQANLEEKTIKDNFIFGAVMRNPDKCKALLECILKIKIQKIEYPELEKTIDNTIESKSVRLDVYVEDGKGTIYNIEMQATDKKNLPKRMRYYQGMIDLNIIDKGQDYKCLKKSYVIFICDYDEFKLGRHIYTFENHCIEVPNLKLGDDTVKIVLNTKGTVDDVSEDVKELLHYIGGDEPKSELTRSLDNEVKAVKSSEKWRREYMTLLMRDNENKTIGKYSGFVSYVRDLDESQLDVASKILKCDISTIETILSLIDEHPEMDDEEIAEIYINQMD